MAHSGGDGRSLAKECSRKLKLVISSATIYFPEGEMSILSCLCIIKADEEIATMNLCTCTPELC